VEGGRKLGRVDGPAEMRRAVPLLGDPARGQVGSAERLGAGNEPVERQGRRHAPDLCFGERAVQPVDGGVPIDGVDHQLGDEVVVLGWDGVAGDHGRVDPDPRAGRHHPVADPAGGGGEVPTRVLCRQPDLDGMAVRRGGQVRRGANMPGQRATCGQPQLLANDVDPRDQLGHAMLDLESRVDLEEVERPVRGTQEFGGGRVLEPRRGCQRDRHRVQLAPLGHGEARSGRLLDQLLMTALQGAVALAKRHDGAGSIAEQLDLDVAGRDDLALEVDRAVAKRGQRLGRPARERGGQLGRLRDPAHPPSPATGSRLDEEWKPDLRRRGDDPLNVVGAVHRRRLQRARHDRDADVPGKASRVKLIAERLDACRTRSDERHTGFLEPASKCRSLRQEAVAGMDRVRAGRCGGIDNSVDPKVALGW
jgi:hypothetical protein